MDVGETDFVSTPLVRRYSHQLAQDGQNDTMSAALVASVKHEEDLERVDKINIQNWNGWLLNVGSPKTPFESRLEQHKQVVIEEWKKLASSNRFKITADNSVQGIPSIDDLWKAVESAGSTWQENSQTGFHKLRDRFCSFAGAMGSYSYLFQVIPSGDKYFSLITGVVSSLIKVSANYRKAAEALSEGLMGLGNSLSYVGHELSISNTTRIQEHVVELYTEVFKFLSQAFAWYSSKTHRAKTALNSEYATKDVNRMVTRITEIVSNIRREAEQSSRSKINNIAAGMVHLEDKIDELGRILSGNRLLQMRLIAHQQQQEQEPGEVKELLMQILGRFASSTLQAVEQQSSHGSREDSLESLGLSQNTTESPEPIEPDDTNIHNRYDIEKFTSSLRLYVEDGRYALLNMQRTQPQSRLSADTLHSMGNWIKATKTTFLYIEGQTPPGVPSMLSMAAMQLCDIALEANLPCLSFFCQRWPRGKKKTDITDKQAGLIALLYSIMLQLTQLLPAEFEANVDLTESRFEQFNGAFSTVDEALRMIDSLMEQLDCMLHWILDGINLIEDRDTRPYIIKLIELLRKKGEQTACKVCFTTNGNSYVLNRSLSVTERLKEQTSFTMSPGRIHHGVVAEDFKSTISRPSSRPSSPTRHMRR